MDALRIDSLSPLSPHGEGSARMPARAGLGKDPIQAGRLPNGPDSAHRPADAKSTTSTRVPGSAQGEAEGGPPLALLRDVAEELQDELQALGKHSLRITYAEDVNRFVVSVVDSETQEVIRQLPPEALLEAQRQLDELRGLLFDNHS